VGGQALVGTLAIGYFLTANVFVYSAGFWIGLLPLAALGLVDDLFDVRARWKALASMAIAATVAAICTQSVLAPSQAGAFQLFGLSLPGHPILAWALLLMLFWGMPQAFNLIDGANGLTLGYALVVLVILGLAGASIAVPLGAVAGVLLLNWPRSRLFLGDCGSLSLGLLLAILAFQTFGSRRPEAILWLFAYPILDVTQVVMVRIATGQALGAADRNHLHHRWEALLGSHAVFRVPILWAQAALCASGALLAGPWMLLPWTGLMILLLQVALFSSTTIRAHRRHRRLHSALVARKTNKPQNARHDRMPLDGMEHSSVGG
jgi:UDP-GlcNAc:undecaprenyl-phosphate GlcNAc-1-phosphate transferase